MLIMCITCRQSLRTEKCCKILPYINKKNPSYDRRIISLCLLVESLTTCCDIQGENIQILLKTWVCFTALSFFHWLQIIRCFFYNKPQLKFVHSSDHTEHHSKWPCYLIRSRRDCSSANPILKWNSRLLVTQRGISASPAQTSAKVNCKLLSHYH